MLKFFSSLIILVICTGLCAQSSDSMELLGDNSRDRFFYFFDEEELDSAMFHLQQASTYHKGTSPSKYVTDLNDQAFLYYLMDNNLGFKNTAKQAYSAAKEILAVDDPEFVRAQEQMNSYHYSIGNYRKSLEILREVVSKKNAANYSDIELATSYVNVGTAYKNQHDYYNALQNFKKAERILKGKEAAANIHVKLQTNIGRVYHEMGQLDSALLYFEKGYLLSTEIGKERLAVTNLLESTRTAIAADQLGLANDRIQLLKGYALMPRNKVSLAEVEGAYLLKRRAYREAEVQVLKAEQLSQSLQVRSNPPLIARRKQLLQEIQSHLADRSKRAKTIDEGIATLSGQAKEDTWSNAALFVDKPDAIKLLAAKMEVLLEAFIEQKEISLLDEALAVYDLTDTLIGDLRKEIISEHARNDLAAWTVDIYQVALELHYQYYRRTGDKAMLLRAFEVMEKNKSILLLEGIRNKVALYSSDIPTELLDLEQEIALTLAHYQNKRLTNELSDAAKEDVLSLREQQNTLLADLERDYPKYHTFKYKREIIDASTVISGLDRGEANLSYFASDDALYSILVTDEKVNFIKHRNPALIRSTVELLVRNLTRNPDLEDPLVTFQDFAKSAYILYDELLGVHLSSSSDIKYLTIVPDYYLNFLPFEVLLSERPDLTRPSYQLSRLEYVVESYEVVYQYSNTLSSTLHRSSSNEGPSSLTFRPDFSTSSFSCFGEELLSLRCSDDQRKSSTSDMVVLDSDQATADRFLVQGQEASTIHLVTHACVDTSSGIGTIFFQDRPLTTNDINTAVLDIDLLILGACNTGTGKLIKGEGVMSLNKSFFSAGCKSSILSLWSIHDCSTEQLMTYFSDFQASGQPARAALRNAKLKYLETAPKPTLHPYYWSGMVGFGKLTRKRSAESAVLIVNLFLVAGIFLFSFFIVKMFVGKK